MDGKIREALEKLNKLENEQNIHNDLTHMLATKNSSINAQAKDKSLIKNRRIMRLPWKFNNLRLLTVHLFCHAKKECRL